MDSIEIKQLIEDGIDGAQVAVSGDGRHFDATVISDAFANKSILEQHRMVYGTLGGRMESDIHALKIRTYTAEQWKLANNPP